MTRGVSSPAPNALAAAEGDLDYFATETHYLSLVNRIDATLRAGGSVVLVTGDPPAAAHLFSQALRKSTQSRYAVIDIACRADLTSEDLSRARSVVAMLPESGAPIAVSETSEPPPPLFVLADVDQLSDRQIKEIFEATQHGSQKGTAVLLLARPGFLTRLEKPPLQFLKEPLAAQFGFQEVGQDEGIEFLRHQLAARHARSEPRGIPAGIFRGLAVSGVLLTIGIGVFLFLQYYHFVGEPSARSVTGIASKPDVVAPRSTSDTPAAEIVPNVPKMPPIAGSPQPAHLPQEAQPRDAAAPTEDRAIPQASSSTAAPDRDRPAPALEMTSPGAEQPPARDAATRQTPSPASGSTATQSARLPDPMPPVASPTPELQQTAPKAASHPASVRPATPSANQRLSPTEIAALVTRGDGFLSAGDIVSARLFYERAADAGNGSAALRLGTTFDPGFLSRAGIRGIAGDPAQAASWYRRARELGGDAAAQRLKDVEQQRAAEPSSPPR